MSTASMPAPFGAFTADYAVAGRLARDLRAACEGLSAAEWGRLMARSAAASAKTTARTRWSVLRRAGAGATDAIRHVAAVGPRQAASDAWTTTVDAFTALPSRARKAFDQFRSMTRGRQVDEVIQMLLTWLVFYAAAGGSDLEGGLPDLDLMTGIGNHRTVFTHSVLLGIETEFAMRFGLHSLDSLIQRMPADRHPVWDRVHTALSRYGERTITGVWLGIGAHLIKDAGLLHLGATKPVVGMPVPMPMEAHQVFLASNGVAAAAMAGSGKAQDTSKR
ncbi:MAG: hypothetical protein GX446_15505 [Chthonomonadales bacterium]|nr:hypothetical protein [Chthonomonadales bacterium]